MTSLYEGLVRRLRRDRVEKNRRRFDLDAGYDAYHEFCRSRFARSVEAPESTVPTLGFERFPVIEADEAATLRRRIETDFKCAVAVEKSPHLLHYQIDDDCFDRELLERILTPAFDSRAIGFFRSEYFVHWYGVSRAVPVPELGENSFSWHCDRGPRNHLKLIVYLNDHSEHGGGTEFLDAYTTSAIARTGYVFGPVKSRLADLSQLAARAGVDYAPWCAEMSAGDGLLFSPARVLHRGLVPTRGPRVVVTVCLLPSPVHWRVALERGAMLRRNRDGKWHSDASVLREILGECEKGPTRA